MDHGNAKNASYEYIVVPNVSAASLEAYSKNLPLTIISNTPELQAVSNNLLGITQAVLYTPGKIAVGDDIELAADNPCILMVTRKGKKIIKVSVADPTHKLSSLSLTINRRVGGSGTNWNVVEQGNNASVITVQLPTAGYAGQTVVMQMK
jgi:hypothetical protein